MSARVDAFIEQLCELDIDLQQLREDPSGQRWLPPSLVAVANDDPECARELAEFIDMELALLDVHEPCDAFFTRAVMDRLPEIEAVDDRRRNWILASAYALAIGVTYLLIGSTASGVGELGSWLEPLHGWYHEHAVEAGSMWLTLALVVMAAVMLLPLGERRVDA